MTLRKVVVNELEWNMEELEDIVSLSVKPDLNLEYLPLANKRILFSDDKWDFSDSTVKYNRISPTHYKYDFSIFPYEIKPYIKHYILHMILVQQLRFQTIKNRYYDLVKFGEFLVANYILNIGFIDYNNTKKFLEEVGENSTNIRVSKYLEMLNGLFKTIERLEDRNIFLFSRELFAEYYNQRGVLAERENGKTDPIAKEYFKCLVQAALSDIEDSNLNKESKIEACLILLLSQIGMRIGELGLIEADKVQEVNIFNGEVKASYLEFLTYKTVKEKEPKWTKTFLTELSEKAYKTLVEITSEERSKLNTSYLFYSKIGRNKGETVNLNALRRKIVSFVVRHKDEIPCINNNQLDELKRDSFGVLKRKHFIPTAFSNSLSDDDYISYPLPHQFRVTVCTNLYEQGVDIDWIREHMNHLSLEMTTHYIREQEMKEAKIKEVQEIVKTFVTNEKDVEGNSVLQRKVDRFIKQNKVNTNIDLDTLISDVKKKVPIREKEQGYCIKGNHLRKCPKNTEIDIPALSDKHLVSVEFLDITYSRYDKMKTLIKYNSENGFTVEAERETKRLLRLVETYLIPELSELELLFTKYSISQLKKDYPNLHFIIDNVERIKREVEKWII